MKGETRSTGGETEKSHPPILTKPGIFASPEFVCKEGLHVKEIGTQNYVISHPLPRHLSEILLDNIPVVRRKFFFDLHQGRFALFGGEFTPAALGADVSFQGIARP